MRTRGTRVIGLAAALWVATASVAKADVVVSPFDPIGTEGAVVLGFGIVFVLIVSGGSFLLLRRMARQRRPAGGKTEPSTPAAPDEAGSQDDE